MKSIIPFLKELTFDGKLSEITSISLEREFEIKETSIDGNLFVTGDYKSHEVSANVIPFSFKIPFSIEIPDNLKRDTITLEISDFAYDILENNKIQVHIELELCGDMEEKDKETFEETSFDGDEFLKMMSEDDSSKEEEEVLNESFDRNEKESEDPLEEKEDMKETPMPVLEDDVVIEGSSEENPYAMYHIHIVKEGETVETICTMYHSNLSLLQDYNDLDHITPGEKVIIPFEDES